ncbi:MAG: hypothetical protein JNJ43_09585 [Anaerolineales bacterium]|nr:hypothetical protein [Anaerolineales bacterium]
MFEDNMGRVPNLEYRYTKIDGKKVYFLDEEIKICVSFFEKEALVTFAREDVFKQIPYPYIFIRATSEFRKKLLLEFEPDETLVLFLRQDEINDRFLDFVDNLVSSSYLDEVGNRQVFRNRIGQVRKFILVSKNPKIVSEIEILRMKKPDMRVVIPFSYDDFFKETQQKNIWQKFHSRFNGVDLFGYSDALINDWDFVGRQAEVDNLYDIYDAGKNSGLFGLRKIGKTSVLYALMRRIRVNGRYAFYFDCSTTTIYKKRWFELIQYIGEKILDEWQSYHDSTGKPKINRTKYKFDEKTCGDTLREILKDATSSMNEKRFLLIFDEIDKITYGLKNTQSHWRGDNGERDFLEFWQALRSISQHHPDLLGFIVAGINPRILEIQFLNDGEDNPIFTGGGMNSLYLPPFSLSEVKEMISRIAMLMGVHFSEEMYSLLATEYGGHPFLTRKACSYLVREYKKQGISAINDIFFRDIKNNLTVEEILKNIVYIIETLQRDYEDEYKMLELLAKGDHDNFRRILSEDPVKIIHLQNYGLTKVNGDKFQITIPSIKEYLISHSTPDYSFPVGGKSKRETIESHYKGVLSELYKITNNNGDYNEQRKIILSRWSEFSSIFGDKEFLNMYFDICNRYNSDNHIKTDKILNKPYFDILEEEYKKYLMAFDWIRERIDVYVNLQNESVDKSNKEETQQFIFKGDYIAGGVKITGDVKDGAIVSIGDENKIQSIQSEIFEKTFREVDKQTNLSSDKKEEIKQKITAVKDAISDGDEVNESFLETRLKNIKNMAPEIADVFLASLISPASGFAMVVQKIARRVKESSS